MKRMMIRVVALVALAYPPTAWAEAPVALPLTPAKPVEQSPAAQTNDEKTRLCARCWPTRRMSRESVFKASGRTYHKPKLVVFEGADADRMRGRPDGDGGLLLPARSQRVYRPCVPRADEAALPRPWRFAMAYVIAREVGHHVQTELGITDKVQAMKERSGDQVRANALQVRMELQADCLAGVWASIRTTR